MTSSLVVEGVGGLVRAILIGFGDDGTVRVRGEDGTSQECELLRVGQGATALAIGSPVLCWFPAPGSVVTLGVVLGAVGPRPVLQADEHPAELVIEAKHSITLRVGEGSITIREDGKIVIKGTDLVSHAKRLNRIKGGAVQIN